MMDREHVVAVLRRHFPDAPDEAIDAAANRIVGLDDEWQEVTSKDEQMGYHYSAKCADICYLADQVDRGTKYRLFLRRPTRKW
jgi:hypothetical protein